MAVNMRMPYTVDLDEPVVCRKLATTLIHGDAKAHEFRITVEKSGAAADLTGYSAECYVMRDPMRSDGTIVITGSVSKNVVTVTLPEACYAEPCRVNIIIRLSSTSGYRATLLWASAQVAKSQTDTLIDPSGVIPSLSDLLAYIDEMRTATTAANTASTAANTAKANADAATSKANTAAASATNAANTANTAATAANTATERANTATTAANAASTAANTAKANADAATSKANTAAASATNAANTVNAVVERVESASCAAEQAASKLEGITASAQETTDSAAAEVSEKDGHYHLGLMIPRGKDGVVGELGSGLWTMEINSDGDLLVRYPDNASPPPLTINESGDLIYTID